jgi:penicillin-insensitive murein endopeptidase
MRMTPKILVALLTPILLAESVLAEPPSPKEAQALLRLPSGSTSLGRTNGGRLASAAELPHDGQGYRVLSFARGRKTNYGTRELVGIIDRATRDVRAAYPGSLLAVGNLGFESGEKIPWSVSHQAGRDADLGMYATTLDGEPMSVLPFHRFDDDGLAEVPGGRKVRFDVPRNLKLVVNLVEDAEARVQYIFVAAWLKQRLLAEAVKSGVAPGTIARLAEVLHQPTDSNPHADHYHVRLFCSIEDRLYGCLDRGPARAWVDPGDAEHAEAARRVASILTMSGRGSSSLKVAARERLAAMMAWTELDAVVRQLSSPEAALRTRALETITTLADPRAADGIAAILPSVTDPAWAAKLFAAIPELVGAAVLHAPKEPHELDGLGPAPDPLVSLAERVLAAGGVEALLLPKALAKAGPKVRVAALALLGERGEPRHVPLLLTLAEDEERAVVKAALSALAERSCHVLRNAKGYRGWYQGAIKDDELSWIEDGLGGAKAFPRGMRTRDGVGRLIGMLDKRPPKRSCAWRALVTLTGHDADFRLRSPERNKKHWRNWWADNAEASSLP